jgi:uncharacterized Tic20 family protein
MALVGVVPLGLVGGVMGAVLCPVLYYKAEMNNKEMHDSAGKAKIQLGKTIIFLPLLMFVGVFVGGYLAVSVYFHALSKISAHIHDFLHL